MSLSDRAYTIHDVIELNTGGWPRFEVLDGALLVSPAPGLDHQNISDNLRYVLGRVVPPKTAITSAANLRLHDDLTAFIPDLVVTHPEVKARDRAFYEADDALLVIEVVSPGNRRQDRVTKHAVYAEAGIPFYWRVETVPFRSQGDAQLPVVLVHALSGDGYRELERLPAGEPGRLTHPFTVEFDPQDMLDPYWSIERFRD
ncbi:Uma2 family endonuclease [Actinomadura kijaniata]|uniref:Uma2 family endonuclease n=1 Tax=Actinomadura kijaniata TaxID=46161 RepID=UPI001C3F3E5B|nr:Uma2 family endonuclease [Actinomadura kijaniata]